MTPGTRLTVRQLLNRARAWDFNVRVDRDDGRPTLVVEWKTRAHGERIPQFVIELVQREDEVLAFLER